MSSNINRNKKVSLTDSAETFQPRKVLLLLLLSFYNSIVAINHTLPTFQGYTPHYFCQVDNVSATVEGCVKEMNTSVQTKEPSCPQSYQFESERGDWTIVTEWQLVCERRYLRPMIATVYFCGVTIGAFICGFLADRYGRRIILLSCLYTQGILGLSLYFITSLEAFMALRFVQGFFLQGLQGTTFALLIELFPPKSRTAVAVVIDIYWPLGLMFLAGASYCIPQWRPLQLLLSAPTAATLFYMCLVPESPRWLATHRRRQETTALWSKIICADQKTSLDRNSLKTVQLCNEIGHSDNKKELVCKVLEKNESIYKHQNIITKENSDSECNENIKPCLTDANDLESKIYIKVTDSPTGSNENSTCGVTEQTPNEDLMAKKISNDAESGEINQESNNPDLKLTVNNGSCLLDNEHYYMKDGAHGSIFTKSSGTCDDPACLWKEIINELGYDIDKTLSDIQESCKKTVQTYPTEETLDNAKCIRVEVNTRDDGSGALQAATSNNASGVSKGMVGAKCKVVHEINQNFSVGNEELVTDLDDNTTDERETGKPLIFCNNEEKSPKENNQANILDLFRSDVLRKYNLIMMLVWFSVAISYYGIMFYLPGLSGERHLNFFLSALLELLSFVLVYFILSRFGRRLPMSTFLFVTSFSCLTVGAISVIPEEDVPWIGHVQTVLALLGKSGALACFCTMFLYASELFPTVVRAVAMGHFGFWARVGSLLSPQLIFLGEYTLPAIPLIIIGVMGMLSGISIFALPETLGKQLPDTIEEAELLAHEKKKIKKLFT